MTRGKLPVYPVLLAGGVGSRLWPLSRELSPKQLVKLIGDDSLLQRTIKRLEPALDTNLVRIVCGEEHREETSRQLSAIGIEPDSRIICEPCGRNTAPAVLLAAVIISREVEDAVMCVFPADHVIRSKNRFHDRLGAAIRLAEEGSVVTFGIQPHYAETGYGYIEGAEAVSNDAFVIKRFVEKPDRRTAEQYLQAGNFFWNSGMFAFKASVIREEFKKFAPDLLEQMESLVRTDGGETLDGYDALPNISFDIAIMENTEKGVVAPSAFGWSDIGSWKSLYDFLPKDDEQNVIKGDVISKDTSNCFIMGGDRLVTTNRLSHIAIVETGDAIYVSDIEHSRDVKEIVSDLQKTGRPECRTHRAAPRPRGCLDTLAGEPTHQVEELTLHPGSRIRIQAEPSSMKHMVVVNGSGKCITEDGARTLRRGEAIMVRGGEAIDLENTGNEPYGLIQVQMSQKGK